MKIARSHTTPQFEKDFLGLPKIFVKKQKEKLDYLKKIVSTQV
jgi:hypothetical protein